MARDPNPFINWAGSQQTRLTHAEEPNWPGPVPIESLRIDLKRPELDPTRVEYDQLNFCLRRSSPT